MLSHTRSAAVHSPSCATRADRATAGAMIAIAPQLSWSPVEGELAVYDSRDGRYHVLNGTAADIWRRLSAGKQAGEIAAELAGLHRAPEEEIRRDIDAFIASGLEMGLLVDA